MLFLTHTHTHTPFFWVNYKVINTKVTPMSILILMKSVPPSLQKASLSRQCDHDLIAKHEIVEPLICVTPKV